MTLAKLKRQEVALTSLGGVRKEDAFPAIALCWRSILTLRQMGHRNQTLEDATPEQMSALPPFLHQAKDWAWPTGVFTTNSSIRSLISEIVSQKCKSVIKNFFPPQSLLCAQWVDPEYFFLTHCLWWRQTSHWQQLAICWHIFIWRCTLHCISFFHLHRKTQLSPY